MPNGEKIKEFAKICAENKISQLNLPDGTIIKMHDFAFYDASMTQIPAHQAEIPTTSDFNVDSIDDDVLFHSAR